MLVMVISEVFSGLDTTQFPVQYIHSHNATQRKIKIIIIMFHNTK